MGGWLVEQPFPCWLDTPSSRTKALNLAESRQPNVTPFLGSLGFISELENAGQVWVPPLPTCPAGSKCLPGTSNS